MPGIDNLPSVGDTDALLGEVEEFLTGGRQSDARERALLTVLFTDIVEGTARAADIGDKRWRDLLASHDAEVRRILRGFDGQEVKTIGDGFLIVFGGAPSAACAARRRSATRSRSWASRCVPGCTPGSASSSATTSAGWRCTSPRGSARWPDRGRSSPRGPTYGTVVGAGLSFEWRGEHELKGVPGHWPVFPVSADRARPQPSG